MLFRPAFFALAVVAGGAFAAEPAVDYPEVYRQWAHVKSMVIQPGHPLVDPFQGIHHVYANEAAVRGLKSGKYPDGAVFVFDLLEYRSADHALTEGGRKLLGVMQRDARRFAETGGWGFEAFAGDSRDQRLVKDGGKSCFACHRDVVKSTYVFSSWRP